MAKPVLNKEELDRIPIKIIRDYVTQRERRVNENDIQSAIGTIYDNGSPLKDVRPSFRTLRDASNGVKSLAIQVVECWHWPF